MLLFDAVCICLLDLVKAYLKEGHCFHLFFAGFWKPPLQLLTFFFWGRRFHRSWMTNLGIARCHQNIYQNSVLLYYLVLPCAALIYFMLFSAVPGLFGSPTICKIACSVGVWCCLHLLARFGTGIPEGLKVTVFMQSFGSPPATHYIFFWLTRFHRSSRTTLGIVRCDQNITE